ncbi:hypothetical protein OGAPHI_006329 [Ogataea philodendri]|uniref:Transcription factor domain-containing protein n=1 Tax=Ogataea philodendri TaxID=1378263 RepID=A0A9P8NYE4_9ASCO|nr:uncharacterized protein OGAPHI_006329 [Ogataea philodendri]KAH3661482.1 hypothetical protein OGAPHI_006329 [Ogataea philodendri]
MRCSLADVNLTESLLSQNATPPPLPIATQDSSDASLSQKLDQVLDKVDLLLGVRKAVDMVESEIDSGQDTPGLLDKLYFDVTPYRDVRRAASLCQMPFSKELAHGIWTPPPVRSPEEDIVGSGLIPEPLANQLVSICVEYYGHWIAMYELPPGFVNDLRVKCPMLLAVMCLLGLRYYKGPLLKNGNHLARSLLQIMQRLLSASILVVPQIKYQIQSLLLISLFAVSLSHQSFYFDGWFLSGYGLLHYITREMDLNLLSDRLRLHPDRNESFRLWNQMVLGHLVYCILSGRPCLIDTLRLDQCRNILEIPSASSFDGRVVAQLSILLTLYNSLQFKEPLDVSLKDLKSSFNDWKHLLEQHSVGRPISITYRFAKVMLYRRDFLTTGDPKSAAELDGECEKLLGLIKDSDPILLLKSSDHIKFVTMFAALTLIQHGKAATARPAVDLFAAWEKTTVYYNDFAGVYRRLLETLSSTTSAQP